MIRNFYISVNKVKLINLSIVELLQSARLQQRVFFNLPKVPYSTTNMPKNRLLIICGPSGSGKSTLLNKMLLDFPDKFGFSVSHTTRKPRDGERNAQHYHFVDEDTMQRLIKEEAFIEHAIYGGHHYGTSKAAVEAVQKEGKVCVLDIDVQGVKQIRKTSLNPWSVFIKPPSMEELRKRLVGRKSESDESLKNRLQVVQEEIIYGSEPGNFDLVIVNDNLDRAYGILKDFALKVINST